MIIVAGGSVSAGLSLVAEWSGSGVAAASGGDVVPSSWPSMIAARRFSDASPRVFNSAPRRANQSGARDFTAAPRRFGSGGPK